MDYHVFYPNFFYFAMMLGLRTIPKLSTYFTLANAK